MSSAVGNQNSIAIIGFGNMGRALARGLLRGKDMQLHICDRFPKPTDAELKSFGMDPARIIWHEADQSASASPPLGHKTAAPSLAACQLLVLATKPQNLEAVTASWSSFFSNCSSDTLVVSILAGIPTATVESLIGRDLAVVRAMPNIAATVDQAATVLCAGRHASRDHLERARAVFDAVGKTWICPEEHLNAVTGLSGSGPAYIYMVIEALSDGGVKMGLSRQLSLELATQTVIGAGILVRETRTHPAVLRDQVTTPGGTTISAIHELERHGIRAMLIQAVVTATRKSAHLLARSLKSRSKYT